MKPKPHIAVVEDDDEILELVADYLSGNGYDVSTATDAEGLDRLLMEHAPALIVLDIMLPGDEDGFAICRRLRAQSSIPILMLTAKGDEIDRILGIEMGADDYLTKPFNPRELTARIGAILRRTESKEREASSGETRCAHLRINFDRREVCGENGDIIDLSSGEYALLTVFLSRPQRVLDRDQILDLVQGRQLGGAFDRSVDVQVSRLRRKVEQDPGAPQLIKTVRNGGYILAAPVTRR